MLDAGFWILDARPGGPDDGCWIGDVHFQPGSGASCILAGGFEATRGAGRRKNEPGKGFRLEAGCHWGQWICHRELMVDGVLKTIFGYQGLPGVTSGYQNGGRSYRAGRWEFSNHG